MSIELNDSNQHNPIEAYKSHHPAALGERAAKQISESLGDLTALTLDPGYKPGLMIDRLRSASPVLDVLYRSHSSNTEGIVLGQHTGNVGDLFEEHFVNTQQEVPVIGIGGMRLLLLLHDIAKPLTFAATGSTHEQDEFTGNFLDGFLPIALGQDGDKGVLSVVLRAVAAQDYVGLFLRGDYRHISLNEAYTGINMVLGQIKNKGVEINMQQLLTLLKIFHQCDAGSYLRHLSPYEEAIDHRGFIERKMAEVEEELSIDETRRHTLVYGEGTFDIFHVLRLVLLGIA